MTTMLKLYPTEDEMLAGYKADCKRYKGVAKLHWNDKSIETVAHDYIYRSQEKPESLLGLRFDAVSIIGEVDSEALPSLTKAAIANVGA
jgi:hypothetical protein